MSSSSISSVSVSNSHLHGGSSFAPEKRGQKRVREPSQLAPNESERQKVQKTSPWLTMSRTYQRFEGQSVTVQGKKAHLYPTDKVRGLHDDFLNTQENDESFPDYLNRTGRVNSLRLSQDTTLYMTPELVHAKTIRIKDSSLMRSNGPFAPGKYIFVIDYKRRLLATTKQRRRHGGRIHHSSLSQGKDVKAAGMIYVAEATDNMYRVTFTNESGHYKPGVKNLDYVAGWLASNGLGRLKPESDTTGEGAYGLTRRVTYLLPREPQVTQVTTSSSSSSDADRSTSRRMPLPEFSVQNSCL